ncbi:MAG: hypothetical protein CSA29_02380 [Desulfobacterales bacterium]|nr:MAG: hypothetical protein CSA29_02380 [Desulfobacterales bacterium]
MKLYHLFFLSVGVFFFTCLLPSPAASKETHPYIPAPLAPWKDWVLHGKEKQRFCTPQYNNATALQCAWPTHLNLNLNRRGGTFSQTWRVSTETWITLPGSQRYWPTAVTLDGQPAIVLEKNKAPGLVVGAGTHTLTGQFAWRHLPEHLTIPPASGLVSLRIDNAKVPFPNLDTQGRLWLKRTQPIEKIENRINIKTFRLIDDTIPANMQLRIMLDVAGTARQITLGPLYSPNNFIPLTMKSPLPARLEQDGRIKIQVRPGQYELRLALRHSGTMSTLTFIRPKDSWWPRQEIWSFNAQPDLRITEISGSPLVDPAQTAMPREWRKLPAYLMTDGASITFKEIKRGDPRPAPDQLSLDRDIWLRFDGSGYTIRDRIRGKKNTNWRLEMDSAIALGSALVDGKEQLITKRSGSDRAGLELRNGQLDITATATYDGPVSTLPATGWDHDFQQVESRLYLPPGWKLISASGMDTISRTWIKRWTLLDFFVVLMFTIALAKLYTWPLAGIAFITLVLTFHEASAPKYIWPVLLTGFALIKYLPDGKIKQVVKLSQGAAVFAFFLIVIPYSIQALRIGIYPQLAQPWTSMNDGEVASLAATSVPAPPKMVSMAQNKMKKAVRRMEQAATRSQDVLTDAKTSFYRSPDDKQVVQYDPNALTQTGPGMPAWHPFETIEYEWSGPVNRHQSVDFILIGPRTNMILAFVRVCAIILLALGMFGIRFNLNSGLQFKGISGLTNISGTVLALILTAIILQPHQVQATDLPSPELLQELEARLLEADRCFPRCADIPDITLDLNQDQLTLTAQVDAHIDTAVPLPGNVAQWLPNKILMDNAPTPGLSRHNGVLWIQVPQGRHILKLTGPVQKRNRFQMPFNLKPRRLNLSLRGWSAEGVHPDGSFDDQLQFKRIVAKDQDRKALLETGSLPAFGQVERTLRLGLVWKIQTRVDRLSPLGEGMVMEIPLLPGESVTTQGIRVETAQNGQRVAKLNFRANQRRLVWDSFLTQTDRITLKHKQTTEWTEIWKVDVSPIFHLEYQGSPVILHKTGDRWYPTWHPRPGETVELILTRPEGIEGPTLTIEKSLMALWPGHHNTKVQMDIFIKSSQGGRHIVTLPEQAELQDVQINNRVQPIRQNGRQVALPITPGLQEIRLTWMDPTGIATRYQSPAVDLGVPSANAGIDLHLPRNRWPLFIGGDHLMGPAVLFWSVLITIAILSLGLTKTGWTPLNVLQWFLLWVGMSMSHPGAGLLVTTWLIALHFRKRAGHLKGGAFNAIQVGLIVLTLFAATALVFAISNGLLGHPDMNIRGNGSSSSLLRWYHDLSTPGLPRAWVISIPMMAYRLAMLAWALWISFWLLGILKWGWQRFTQPVIWQKIAFIRKPRK